MSFAPGTPAPALVVVVCDASNLERNLYLLAQVREWRLPVVVALTMMDTVEADGRRVDAALLTRRIGVPVVPVAAMRVGGTQVLLQAMDRALPPHEGRGPDHVLRLQHGHGETPVLQGLRREELLCPALQP